MAKKIHVVRTVVTYEGQSIRAVEGTWCGDTIGPHQELAELRPSVGENIGKIVLAIFRTAKLLVLSHEDRDGLPVCSRCWKRLRGNYPPES